MKITMKWPLMAAICVLGFGSMVSCDEDEPVTPPTILNFSGNYTGTMTSTIETPEVSPTEIVEVGKETVEFKLDGDSIRISKLSVKSLIEAVLGEDATEEQVTEIVTKLGDVKYDIGYTFTAKTDNSSAELTLAPKPLVLNLDLGTVEAPMPVEVNVTITAKDKGTFTAKDNNLKFGLEVTKIIAGETTSDIVISIAFDATKK